MIRNIFFGIFVVLVGSSVFAQSEQKSFNSGYGSYGSKADACTSAKDNAREWIKQNTERGNSQFNYNQVRRGWAARFGKFSDCDCEKRAENYKCSVDAEIVIDK